MVSVTDVTTKFNTTSNSVSESDFTTNE